MSDVRFRLTALALIVVGCAQPSLAEEVAAQPTAVMQAPATATPDRLVPLEQGQNFREMGGYRTSDGQRVRSGLIYRSGSMHWLTPNDFITLGQRGVRTVVDFRDSRERASEPVVWPDAVAPIVLVSPDPVTGNDDFFRELARPGMDGAAARAMMARFYRDIPTRYAPHYRQLFGELLANRGALVFNCSAGKDRTGMAAALLLTALGVPRETVIADYLLSNTTFRPHESTGEAGTVDPQMAFFRSLPPEVIGALMGVDRSYIENAFAAIEERPGGLEAYYRDELGLDAAAMVRLKMLYLEPVG